MVKQDGLILRRAGQIIGWKIERDRLKITGCLHDAEQLIMDL